MVFSIKTPEKDYKATIDSYDDLLSTTNPSPAGTLRRSRSTLDEQPKYLQPARSSEELSRCSISTYTDESDSDETEEYSRSRVTLSLLGVALIFMIVGGLFVLVAAVLSPNPMDEHPTYMAVGISFVSIGLLVLVGNIIQCQYMQKLMTEKVIAAVAKRGEDAHQFHTAKDHRRRGKYAMAANRDETMVTFVTTSDKEVLTDPETELTEAKQHI